MEARHLVATRVGELMDAKGWTQDQVSAASGRRVSQRAVSALLRGEVGPGIDAVDALASAFGLHAWQLCLPGDVPLSLITGRQLDLLMEAFMLCSPEDRVSLLNLASDFAMRKHSVIRRAQRSVSFEEFMGEAKAENKKLGRPRKVYSKPK